MEKYVVAISIDKVQTFLYERINSHTQEKQSEHGTLRNIIQSSNEISKELKKAINEKFCNKNIKVLLNCSGIQIFYIDIEENEIKENLNKLFVQYYKKFCGQALLKYVYFKKEDNNVIDQLKDISDAKKLLKHKDCMNKIIKENSEVLFKFEKKDYHENDIIIDKYKNFCNTIDELKDRNEKDEDEKEGNGKRFKVVMIKADLDGMGDLFKGLESYEVYDKISKILNEYISFEKLHDYVDILKKQYDDFKIFPLYMAGDDMFFAVLPRHLFAGIELTKFILNGINEELKKDIDLELKSDIINKELRMSIGVEFTYSHEPIRYYYDRVEEQLLIAKKEKCCKDDDFINNKLENYRKFKICINNLVFFDIDRKSLKDELDNTKYTDSNRINDQYKNLNNWRFFVHDMKLLYHIKQSGYSNKIGTRNNLYGLLSKITDS